MTDWLAEIEARWAAATPGPWEQYAKDPRALVATADPTMSLLALDVEGMAIVPHEPDCAAIAAAPTDVARLVAEVRALRDALIKVDGGGTVEIWQDLRVSEDEVKGLRDKNRELNRRAQRAFSDGRKEVWREIFDMGLEGNTLCELLAALGMDPREIGGSWADKVKAAVVEIERLQAKGGGEG